MWAMLHANQLVRLPLALEAACTGTSDLLSLPGFCTYCVGVSVSRQGRRQVNPVEHVCLHQKQPRRNLRLGVCDVVLLLLMVAPA
jgi:hypothetical protein